MRKRIFAAAAVICLSLGIFASDVLCKEEKISVLQRIKNAYNNFRKKKEAQKPTVQPEKPLPAAVTEKKEITKDEMLAELKESIEENDELFDIIPELKSEKDADGKFYYTFKGVKLEELSREDLDSLTVRTRQALVRMRTDRIQKQMETVRQVQDIQRVPVPPQIPQPPQIQQPPQVQLPPQVQRPLQVQQPPQPPQAQRSPPKAPFTPPAPPSRR